MREDELATAVVEHFRAAFDAPRIRLEEPYDHYGNRGSVDVYARVHDPAPVDYLVELKADAALRHATGANEVLRQYRRMTRYFYKDDEHSIRVKLARDGPGVHALLLFAPTEACVRHVREHRALYESVEESGSVGEVPASYRVAFLTNLDRAADGDLGFLSINGEVGIDSDAFRRAVPDDSRLAEALDETRPDR